MRAVFIILLVLVSSIVDGKELESNFGFENLRFETDLKHVSLDAANFHTFDGEPSLEKIKEVLLESPPFDFDNYGKHVLTVVTVLNQGAVREAIASQLIASYDTRHYKLEGDQLVELTEVPFRYNSTSVTLDRGKNTFAVLMYNNMGAMRVDNFNFTLQSKEFFFRRTHNEGLIHGVIFGIVGLLIVYNLFMYWVFRKIYFFHYSLYCLLLGLLFIMLGGYIWYSLNLIFLFGTTAVIAGMLFINSALNIRRTSRPLYISMYIVGTIELGLASYFLC